VGLEQRLDAFCAQGRAGVGGIEAIPEEQHMDASDTIGPFPGRFGLEDRIRPVLDELKYLPIAVTTGEHGLLDPIVLPDVARCDSIRLEAGAPFLFDQCIQIAHVANIRYGCHRRSRMQTHLSTHPVSAFKELVLPLSHLRRSLT
jgi:hypothetical protein